MISQFVIPRIAPLNSSQSVMSSENPLRSRSQFVTLNRPPLHSQRSSKSCRISDHCSDHLVEFTLDLRCKISLNLINLREFGEGSRFVRLEMIHAGDPIRVHRAFLRLRYRRDKLRPPSSFDDFLRGLALRVQFPMPQWSPIRRVKDWPFKKQVGHYKGRSILLSAFLPNQQCNFAGITDPFLNSTFLILKSLLDPLTGLKNVRPSGLG
jgi:hypothetical protein